MTGTNAESGTEFKGAAEYESISVVTTTVVGTCSSPRVEAILSGKLLQIMRMLSNNSDAMIRLLTLFLHWSLQCCYQG